MSLRLRPALQADLPGVVQLMNLAYRGAGANTSWTTEVPYIDGDRTSEPALQEELAGKPDAVLFVAEEGTATLKGCVLLEPVSPTVWHLGSLAVDPRLQKEGLGRQVLHAAEQWAAAKGARAIQIEVVHVRDTLIAWYERRGYRLTGETHPFPYGDNRFGVPRREDLTFVVLEKPIAHDGP